MINIINILKNQKVVLSFFYEYGDDWEDPTDFSLFELFILLAPELIIERSLEGVATHIGYLERPNTKKEPRDNWPVPSNSIKELLADLVALDLVEPSRIKHSVHDKEQYWTLSDTGKELYKSVFGNYLWY